MSLNIRVHGRWHTYCSTGAGAGDIATAMEAVLQVSLIPHGV